MVEEPINKQDYYFIPEIGWLPRVTNILNIISKGRAFDNWLMNKGKEATTIVSDAGDIGSSIHNRLEEIGKGIPFNIEALKERERAWVEEFLSWGKDNIGRFLETEKTIYHAKEGYGGTLDALIETKDKRIALLDYKTSKYCYDTYDLQCSAYIRAYEDMLKTKIDTAFILRFEKGDKKPLLEVKEVKDIQEQYEIFLCALKLWKWKYDKYQESKNV